MNEDEKTTADSPSMPVSPLAPANDSDSLVRPVIDQQLLTIARALGRQIAREQVQQLEAANDNEPRDE